MATGGFYGRGSSSFGYWRGGGAEGPLYGGSGSGMGGTSGMSNFLSAGQSAPGASGWHPTVLYLLALIVGEMAVFHFLARTLR